MSVQAIDSFIPTAPRRLAKQASTLNALFGAASRNTVKWWPAVAFRDPHFSRTLMGITYHAVSDPDAVQRVVLDNVANYGKPRMLRRVMPLLADGLFYRSLHRAGAGTVTPPLCLDPTLIDLVLRRYESALLTTAPAAM